MQIAIHGGKPGKEPRFGPQRNNEDKREMRAGIRALMEAQNRR